MFSNDDFLIIWNLYTFVAFPKLPMSYPVYLEKDSAEIYEEMSSTEEDYQDDEERSSDHMSDMISRYGSY